MSSPDDLLRRLEGRTLFPPELPPRARCTHAEWAELPAVVQEEARSRPTRAIRAVPDWPSLERAISGLALARHAPAVPALLRLWAECAIVPLRRSAGVALRAIGTPEALAALASAIDEADRESVAFGVRATFDLDPATAFDRFARRFDADALAAPGGIEIAGAVLDTFCPSTFRRVSGVDVPVWTEPRAPGWLRGDPRWLDLCADLRGHEALGSIARAVLRFADPDAVDLALAAEAARAPARRILVSTAAVGDLLTRYQRGEHVAVWEALRRFEAVDGDLRQEALSVAHATAERIAAAADRLAERLTAWGWTALSGAPRVPPGPEDRAAIEILERWTPLPPSLRAFWEVVGGVDLVWNYDLAGEPPDLLPGVDLAGLDPLCVDPARAVTHVLETWEEELRVRPELREPLAVDLAPDRLHKANISGGAPHAVLLPFAGVDPVFRDGERDLPFVDHLRFCFRWAGFPGLSAHADDPGVREFVARAAGDLEPF